MSRFAKMTGAGNDFILLDNRTGEWDAITPEFVRRICRRRFSVGADGLMLLDPSTTADFAMRYFNSDGSEAGMCGNGGRCIARFALLLGLAEPGRELTFTAPAGSYRAQLEGEAVRLDLVPPRHFVSGVKLALPEGEREADLTDTGVPHAVLFSPAVDREPVETLGRLVRNHPRFAPAGTNVNFCEVVDRGHLRVRTYERGVEGETLACGTGVAAAALLAFRRGWIDREVAVKTHSGAVLQMRLTPSDDGFSRVQQIGEARLVYWGELSPEAAAYVEPQE